MGLENARFRSIVNVPRLFAWQAFLQPGMFDRLTPPWQDLQTIRVSGTVTPGDTREFELRAGPLSLRWLAVHERFEDGRLFTDRQVKGPFRFWRHEHRFVDAGPDRCELQDEITFELPASAISHRPGLRFLRAELHRMFRYRHFTTFHDLAELYRLRIDQKTIAISGEPVEIARQMGAILSIAGHEVVSPAKRSEHQFDAEIRIATGVPGRLSAVVQFGRDGAGGSRRLDSATLVSPDSALIRLGRALQFFEPDEGVETREVAWTTADDFIFAVYRAVVAGEPGPDILVRHARTPSLLEFIDAGAVPGRAIRLGRPPGAVLERIRDELERTQLDRQYDPSDIDRRSRFRSVTEAVQVLSGQA